jgi:N-methylhydantoinase B
MANTEIARPDGLLAPASEHPADFWDGVTHAYIPTPELRVPDGLRLHRSAASEIDPVTYEVIRHGLWNANAEHVRVIENLAVSPIAVEIRDFQPCILTEEAELLYFGPCLQYMAGMLDIQTRYVIEHRGSRVRDGDMWLCNDPIVGTAHQPDVGLMCPVFIDGEVFCWVANICHQNDIGGTVPGSFCPNAIDAFWDPPSFPPFKIVEDGRIVSDMEALYRRCSRTPENLSLDLRATIAGNHAAGTRIRALVERYGKDVVKGVMHRILDASQRALEEALDTIPDGVYSERLINEVSMTGDRGTYPVVTTVTKTGRTLTFDNAGTHPQAGAINVGFAAWRGAILGTLNVLLLADQMGCVGGGARNCRFTPTPGTITCPDWGAAVSPAGVYATEAAISTGNAVIAKMMLASSERTIRDRALSPDGGQWGCHFVAGINQRGDYYVGGMGDNMLGASGACWNRDGEFANGHYWIPEGRGPNVELYESDWPILYLYRREHADSGGAGRFRSGNGGEIAYVMHGGESELGLYTTESIPKTNGIFGGGPAAILRTRVITGTEIRARFAAGELPQDIDTLGGRDEALMNKGTGLPLSEDDVLYWNWSPAGGYGDPLSRDPVLVAADVAEGAVAAEAAGRVYGVLLGEGGVDIEATAVLRHRLLSERLHAAGGEGRELLPGRAVAPEGSETIADVYLVDRAANRIECHHCGTALCGLGESPKVGMAVLERPVQSLTPGAPDPRTFVDEDVVWRDLLCPGCGLRLATEVTYPGAPLFQELRVF